MTVVTYCSHVSNPFEQYAWLDFRTSYRSDHAIGADAIAPDRVEEDSHSPLASLCGCCFNEEAGVAYPSRLQCISSCTRKVWLAYLNQAEAISGDRDEVLRCVEACAHGRDYS